jgi:hypothetical protein
MFQWSIEQQVPWQHMETIKQFQSSRISTDAYSVSCGLKVKYLAMCWYLSTGWLKSFRDSHLVRHLTFLQSHTTFKKNSTWMFHNISRQPRLNPALPINQVTSLQPLSYRPSKNRSMHNNQFLGCGYRRSFSPTNPLHQPRFHYTKRAYNFPVHNPFPQLRINYTKRSYNLPVLCAWLRRSFEV